MELRPYQKKSVDETFKSLVESDDPVLFTMSVGGGKSLCISAMAEKMQKANKHTLCLVNSSELVRNNAKTHLEQGNKVSIFCASLNKKEFKENTIFATPQSIMSAIKNNHPISKIIFNLIIVDEAHNINYLNHKTTFMRILRHYKQLYKKMRLVGLTGTPFRGNGIAIVGDNCLFKKQLANIDMNWLIKNKYLANPEFTIKKTESIDFSQLKVENTGEFNQKQLQEIINKNIRLTGEILIEVQKIMENRTGAFIFFSTRKHCLEGAKSLPSEQIRLIIGTTPDDERNESLTLAREGKIKYLLSVNCLMTGIDVPNFDTSIWLRPTSSLVLFTQGIGRALRLYPKKENGLILDFAGNIQRHESWDSPLIIQALKQTEDKDKPLVILCPVCMELNTEHARRCVGVANEKRCEYYFEFKDCPNAACGVQNDISSRHCRLCETEIIDPNAKLNMEIVKATYKEVLVLSAKYGISGTQNGFRVNCIYEYLDSENRLRHVYEHFTPISDKARNIFYGNFVRKHCENYSSWYPHLHKRNKVEELLHEVKSPVRLLLAPGDNGFKIKKKFFE